MAKTDNRGWWFNSKGEAVHPELVRPNEKLRDELVEELLKEAEELKEKIAHFRREAEEKIESYYALLLQEYGIDERARSKKGNLALESFSGDKRVEIRIAETLGFDEKLQIAKLKIDEFLNEETKEASPTIQTLIMRAFEVDKEGKIDAKRIFALKSYEISAPKWQEAMKIIDESKHISHSKPYIRFYKRAKNDEGLA